LRLRQHPAASTKTTRVHSTRTKAHHLLCRSVQSVREPWIKYSARRASMTTHGEIRIRLLFGLHDSFCRSIGRSLHSRWTLSLRTFGWRAARFCLDRSRPTLWLQLTLLLGRRSSGAFGRRARARLGSLSSSDARCQTNRKTRNRQRSLHRKTSLLSIDANQGKLNKFPMQAALFNRPS